MLEIIATAIGKKRILRLIYNGEERFIEPHTLGTSSKGNILISAWQITGKEPGWRTFNLIDIENLSITQETFVGPRDGFTTAPTNFVSTMCWIPS